MKNDPHWMEKAFSKNKGALHRKLGVKEGERIPAAKLAKATKAKGKLGMEARAAANAKSAEHPRHALREAAGKLRKLV